MNLAIVIGVSHYQHCPSLSACDHDTNLVLELLKRIGRIDDFCVLNNSPSARDAKNEISNFIKKHKDAETIDELIFYYSGHGDRDENDFYFLFSDYQKTRQESTILRNTELDDFIRNFSPRLTVKIVDACYSGELYVKSDGSLLEPIFHKSAEERNLKNLYFFFSSGPAQVSYASPEISLFTYCFLSTVADSSGEIRYRDIMAGIADRMKNKASQEPLFIAQATMTENFCDVNGELATWLKAKLPQNALPNASMTVENPDEQNSENYTLLEMIKKKEGEYCSQEEGLQNISRFFLNMKKKLKEHRLNQIFELEINDISNSDEIVNSKAIGKWLSEKHDEEFAQPTYESVRYETKEYKEIPPKPRNYSTQLRLMSINTILGQQFESPEYVLENVIKYRNEINGFRYTIPTDLCGLVCLFKPNFVAVSQYCFTLSYVFSSKMLTLFYSIEKLNQINWEQYTKPQCKKWQIKQLNLKSFKEIESSIDEILLSLSEFIEGDITAKLSK